ncbi:hypothetical protein BGZ99_010137 [Dissophora globulifera]|uniref:Methionine aminopeptidase n=1 Tax=Dissophora globulifera TaxID=979702 RepID=A0A9P6UYS3_9FUNG|nr:hypothetical protein BGZ99_010137 [Dissophora globulifera]
MQEIEVPPRDVFQHYVHVDQSDKTLVWWFSTKKKNISFGLFFRKSSPPQLKSNTLAPSITSVTPPARPESISSKRALSYSQHSQTGSQNGALSTSPTKSIHASNYASSRASIDTNSDDEDQDGVSVNLDNPSQSSLPAGSQPSARRKKTVAKFKDPELIEIMPIQHYDSSTGTIRGEYTVKEEGSYVLVFDNSFSIHTSKRLTFFVALEERGGGRKQPAEPSSEMSGWLLKKKRKRMQGWAKRWFQIDNGVLSYYKDPDSPCRGKVHLVLSTVTVSQASNMIHIDSGTMLYHLKALTVDEYSAWTSVIKAIKNSDRAAHDTVHRMTLRESSQKRAHLRNSWIGSNNELDQLKEIMSAMDAGFLDIKEQLESIRVQTESLPSSGSSQKSGRERQSSIENNANGNGNGNSKFKIGKFAIPSLQRTTSDGSIASTQSLESIHSRLQTSFTKLKSDKEKAFNIMRSEIEKWEKNEKQFRMLLTENENLSTQRPGSTISRQAMEEAYIARTSMNSERTHSFTSSIHTGSDVFYDADDTILTADPDLSDLEGAGFDDEDDDNDNTSDDEWAEEHAKAEEDAAAKNAAPAVAAGGDGAEEPIVRRSVLPAPVSGEDISLLSILRKNVGKDLSTVAMPVSLNEPINVLQRLCEELEYSELLDKAAGLSDSLDRLVYVSAFAVSGYATTQWRAARKPFNPLHGETFEFVSPEKGFKFISEKVSHYPPVMACHAESVHNWSFSMDSRAKTKFWGKSMELIPNGTTHIYFHKTGDHFTIHKPSTWMRNLMAGTKYLEHTGELKVVNHTTRESCVLTFKESSFFSGTKNEVVGQIMDANNNKKRTLQGKWSEALMEEVGPNKFERLWKVNNPPANHEKYYGFTEFTMQLNELTKGLEKKLPKTDTRFRPDQSLFEHGRVEEADKEKLRVEQQQRELRKTMETEGEPWQVRWFEKKPDPQTDDPEGQTWRYKGGYWEARETGEWNEKISLWTVPAARTLTSPLASLSNIHAHALDHQHPHRKWIHLSNTAWHPRRTTRGAADRDHFGKYERLSPTSLRLGVVPPNVDGLVPPHILRPHYAQRGESPEWSTTIPKNGPEAIEGCRKAGQLAKKILTLGGTLVKSGVTTNEIDRVLHEAIIANNAYPSPLNYMGFPKSICTSVSNIIAHGIPDERPLKDGDIVNIDITVYLEGYHGDTSATFLVGDVDQAGRDLVERTKESLEAAIAICGPGVPLHRIGKTIQDVADKYGYTISEQFTGHGIGREFHCLPLIHHYENDFEGEMEPGMIFTIEPSFCQGHMMGVQWPDKWTVATIDGGRSAQFEHTIVITETGAEKLTG